MNEVIKTYLESMGFLLISGDDKMRIFVKKDEYTIIDIVFMSDHEFSVIIKSDAKTGENLVFSKKVQTKGSENIYRPIKNEDIIRAYYLAISDFQFYLSKHIENLKTIQNVFDKNHLNIRP